MSLETILKRIQTDIQGCPGMSAGRVHLGTRQFHTSEHWTATGQDPGWSVPHIHVWFVSRSTSAEIPFENGRNIRQHSIQIEAYYQTYDPTDDPRAVAVVGTEMVSEISFSGLVEAACTALRTDEELMGGIAGHITPPEVTTWDTAEVDGKLCHHAVISCVADEYVTYSYGA